jgi:hypothetical protein
MIPDGIGYRPLIVPRIESPKVPNSIAPSAARCPRQKLKRRDALLTVISIFLTYSYTDNSDLLKLAEEGYQPLFDYYHYRDISGRVSDELSKRKSVHR